MSCTGFPACLAMTDFVCDRQRKNLSHQQLMTETIQQLTSRFQPDINMIKKKIEALIDREYIERGTNPNKPSYTYLA